MKKVYFIRRNKYRKFKNRKISYIFDKTLVLSIIYEKCGSNDEKIFKEKESVEILNIHGSIKHFGEYQVNI